MLEDVTGTMVAIEGGSMRGTTWAGCRNCAPASGGSAAAR